MRKTKIVCTIGPVTQSEEMMRKLMEHGMNVARFNFSQDRKSVVLPDSTFLTELMSIIRNALKR